MCVELNETTERCFLRILPQLFASCGTSDEKCLLVFFVTPIWKEFAFRIQRCYVKDCVDGFAN
jgi:hypothetical protein